MNNILKQVKSSNYEVFGLFSKTKKIIGSMIAVMALVLITCTSVHAVSITVDQIIYEAGVDTDPTMLSGTIEMTVSGSELWITLTNTSVDGASTIDSNLLLTGVGFNLTAGLDIASGSASAAGETAINWTHQDDVSGEWGYANEQQGQFNTVLPTGSVDTIVSAMEASTDFKFSATPVLSPDGLEGPEFGLLSDNQTVFGSGLAAIQNSLDIHLAFNSTDLTGLLSFIEAGEVVLSFGSSDSPGVPVPEPATAALLGIGLVGLAGGAARRKWKKKAVENS